jgi:hypothetical protein
VDKIPANSQPITVTTTIMGDEVHHTNTFPSAAKVPPWNHLTTYDSIYDRITTKHQTIRQQNQIRSATSNTGTGSRSGSFGWVLQVGNCIFARGNRPAYSPDPQLFQAEGYGMASVLLFLQLLKQQFKID